MQNKQEALQVLLATYSKLKSLYAEHLELEEDAAEEDRLLFDKVGRLYDKLVKKKPEAPDEDPELEWNDLKETIANQLKPAKSAIDKSLNKYKTLGASGEEIQALENLVLLYKSIMERAGKIINTLSHTARKECAATIKVLRKERVFYDNLLYSCKLSATEDWKANHQKTMQSVQDALFGIPANAPDFAQRKAALECFETDYLAAIKLLEGKFELKETALEDAKNGGETSFDVASGNVVVVLKPGLDEAFKKAAIVHELQHMIQFSKGKVGFWLNGKNAGTPHKWLYDLTDEVEAYQVQFAMNALCVPPKPDGSPVSNSNEIDLNYIRNLGYTQPATPLSTSSTLEDIDTALSHVDSPSTLGISNYNIVKKMKLADFLQQESSAGKTWADNVRIIIR